jgi:RsiW-degrading membrane proteinase PrsW (M82 family)
MTPSDPYPATPQPAPGTPGASAQPEPNAPAGAWYPPGFYYPTYGAQGYYYPPYFFQPPQPPRDMYRLVVGIIATVALSLLILGGLFGLLLTAVGASLGGSANDLPAWTLLLPAETLALVGGSVGLYLTIRAFMGLRSAPMRLPPFALPLGLSVLALAAAIVLFDSGPPVSSALAQVPLIFACVALPSVTILAFTSQRLGNPSTWRHVWLSALNGFFLAALLALILEAILGSITAAILGSSLSTGLQSISSANIILTLIVGSVIAPVVEEGVKPIGALIILGRLRGPAEAFLVGMAAGLGFAVFESLGYVGLGSADWPAVALERFGTGLLHGIGAGMMTLGFYYLFRGEGVANRYAKGFGAIAYAVLQHSFWNGIQVLLSAVGGPIGNFFQTPFQLVGLPLQGGDAVGLMLYLILIAVLVVVTGRLRNAPQRLTPAVTTTAPMQEQIVPAERVMAR